MSIFGHAQGECSHAVHQELGNTKEHRALKVPGQAKTRKKRKHVYVKHRRSHVAVI